MLPRTVPSHRANLHQHGKTSRRLVRDALKKRLRTRKGDNRPANFTRRCHGCQQLSVEIAESTAEGVPLLIRPWRCQALDTTIVAPPERCTHRTFSTSLKPPPFRKGVERGSSYPLLERARKHARLNGGPREPASRSRAAPNPADAYCPASRCPDPGCVRQLPAWDAERHRAALPHGRSCGVWHVAWFAMPAPLQSTDRALLTRFCHAHRLRALGSVRPRRPNAGAAESSGGAKAQGQREGLTGEGARARRKAAAAAPAIATVYLP